MSFLMQNLSFAFLILSSTYLFQVVISKHVAPSLITKTEFGVSLSEQALKASKSLSVSSHNKNHKHHHGGHKGSDDFDYYVFTQLWPVSNCDTASSSDKCEIPDNVTGWLIHGLWPSNFDGSWPSYCDDGYKFNDEEISSIWGLLATYWTNLYMDEAVDSFWEHEWDKHGTCAYEAKQVSSEFDYFNSTLQLHWTYPLGDWLKDEGIFANNTKVQNAVNLQKIISGKLGSEAILQCIYDEDTKLHLIYQVEICLDLNLQPIDCDKGDVIENCPSDGDLVYPASVTKESKKNRS